jgi:hypothetical protein
MVVSMGTSWRSGFWNAVAFLGLALLGAISVGIAIDELRQNGWVLGVPSALGGFWAATGAIRSIYAGVYVRQDGIVIRNYFWTSRIPWAQVVSIGNDRITKGVAGMVGASSVVVMRRKPGSTEVKPVELTILGNYGLGLAKTTPADRARVGLADYLQRWQQLNGVADSRRDSDSQ